MKGEGLAKEMRATSKSLWKCNLSVTNEDVLNRFFCLRLTIRLLKQFRLFSKEMETSTNILGLGKKKECQPEEEFVSLRFLSDQINCQANLEIKSR